MIEAEKGEYVTNRKSTAKYYDLIEAINKDSRTGILDYLVKDLYTDKEISFPEQQMRGMVQFAREYEKAKAENEGNLEAEVRLLRQELQEIKVGTNRIPKRQYVNAGENKYAEITESSTVIRTFLDRG